MLQVFSRSHCRGRPSEWTDTTTLIMLIVLSLLPTSTISLPSNSVPKMFAAGSSLNSSSSPLVGLNMQGPPPPPPPTGISPGASAGITFAVLVLVFAATFFIYRNYHLHLKRMFSLEHGGMLRHHYEEEDYKRFQPTALPLRLPLPVVVSKKLLGKHHVYADSGIGESTIMSSSFSHHRNSSATSSAISEVIRMEQINEINRKRQSSLPMVLPPLREASLPDLTIPNHVRHRSLPGVLSFLPGTTEPSPQNHGLPSPQQRNENPAQSSAFPFPPPPIEPPPPAYKLINTPNNIHNIQVQAKQPKPYSDIHTPPPPHEDKAIRRATLSLRNSILNPFKDKRDDTTSHPPQLPPSPLPHSLPLSPSRSINRLSVSIPAESLLTPTINESRLSTERRQSVASMQWYGFDDSMDMRDVEPSRRSKFFITNLRDSSVNSSQRSSRANSKRSSGRSSINRQLAGLSVGVGKIEEDEIALRDGQLQDEEQEGDEEEEEEENDYEIEERPLKITDFTGDSDYFNSIPPAQSDPTFILTPTLQVHQPDPFNSVDDEEDMNDQLSVASSPVPSSSRRTSYQETRIRTQSRNSFGVFEEERNASKSSLVSIASNGDRVTDKERRDSELLDYRYIRTRSMAPEIQWQPSQIAAFDILAMESKLYPDLSAKENVEENEDSDSEVEDENYLQAVNTKLLLSNPSRIELPPLSPVSPLRFSGFGITDSQPDNLKVPSLHEDVRTSVLEVWENEGYGAALYSE